MTHLNPQNQRPEFHDELLASRVEEIRREIATAPAVVAKSKKTSLMRGLIFPVVIILIWLAITQYRFFNPQAGTSVFIVSEPEVLGLSDLCPGDSLHFRFGVEVLESGVYTLRMSTWRDSPSPATQIFSEGESFASHRDRSFPVEEIYFIDQTYASPIDGKPTRWIPGIYSRDVAVTAEGRNTDSSTLEVPFQIKENCIASASYRTPLYSNP